MLRRKLRVVARSMLCCSGFSSSTLTPLPSLVAVPLVSLSSVLVDKGFGDEAEGLALGILERRRLLVGEPRRVAGVDAGHEAEGHGVAFAGRAVELVDHAAGDAGDAGTVGGLVERQVVDGAVRRKQLRGDGRREAKTVEEARASKCKSALRASRNSSGGGL